MARKLKIEHGEMTPSSVSETEFREQIVAALPHLMTMARSMSSSSDLQMEAEDLVQATIYRALLRFRQWRQDGDLAAWLFVIMRSVALNDIRATSRRMAREANAAEMTPRFVETEHRLHDRMMVRAIGRLCPDLTAEDIWLLGMVYAYGYTGEELATYLDKSQGSIYGRLVRARAKVARRVADAEHSR